MTSADVVNWAQIVGALGFPVAFYALWRAKRDILAERRASHELEVLRAFVDLFHTVIAARNWPSRAQTYLLLIEGSADMPMSRAALNARPSREAMETYRASYPDAPEWPSFGFDMEVARKRIVNIGEDKLSNELKAAIECRVTKPNKRVPKPNLRPRKRTTKQILPENQSQ